MRPLTLALVLLALAPLPARAGAPTPEDTTARLRWIEARLEAERPAAQRWWAGWLTGFGAVMIVQGVGLGMARELSPDGDPQALAETQHRFLVGTVAAAIGVVSGVARPWSPRLGAAPLADLPEDSAEQRAAKLRAAEALLAQGAEQEAFGRSWMTHVGGVAINAAAGLVLWLHYDQGIDGLVTFLSGVAVAQVQVWTQPTDLVEAQAAYRRGAWRTTPREAVSWTLLPAPGGLGLRLTFD